MSPAFHDIAHPAREMARLRMLGLEPLSRERRAAPSCVMLQIDGLSWRNFRKALSTGKLPFLARLLRQKKAVAGPWHSMLPTSTSAFQTGLFYGNNDNIPGFFWHDKGMKRRIRMNGPEDTARVEEEVRARVAPYPGLLSGGSSYSALFAGGADNTFMTFARLLRPSLNLTTKKGYIWLFLASQFLLAARVAYYTVIEIVLCIYDLVRAMFTHKNRMAEFKFIVPRILSVVVCREIATLATILDISRGVGPIYVNYFAYDEHAHLRGPDSRFAFWSLRGLDASIRRIWKAAEKARKAGIRQYDVFVWSDHGQTASVPFQDLFHELPERHFDMLFRAIHGPLPSAETARAGMGPLGKKVHVSPSFVETQAHRAEQIEALGPRWLKRVLDPMVKPALEAESRWSRLFPPDPNKRISVVSTGPVAHLCVDDFKGPMTWEDWIANYPFFLELVAQHKGIGFTLVRTREGGCKVGYDGQWMDLFNTEAVKDAMPLSLAQILISRREELLRWANMPAAGDLILFGQRDTGRPAISYSYELGAHAGPSPQETLPFIMVPAAAAGAWPELSKRSGRLLTLRDLHERLRENYNPWESEGAGVEAIEII